MSVGGSTGQYVGNIPLMVKLGVTVRVKTSVNTGIEFPQQSSTNLSLAMYEPGEGYIDQKEKNESYWSKDSRVGGK